MRMHVVILSLVYVKIAECFLEVRSITYCDRLLSYDVAIMP